MKVPIVFYDSAGERHVIGEGEVTKTDEGMVVDAEIALPSSLGDPAQQWPYPLRPFSIEFGGSQDGSSDTEHKA